MNGLTGSVFRIAVIATMAVSCISLFPLGAAGKEAAKAEQMNKHQIYIERKNLFEQMSALTGIPWYYLAAVDQYERTLTIANRKKRPEAQGLIAIYFPPEQWAGALNPDPDDRSMASIAFFNGFGKDGDGDGYADRTNDADLLYSMADFILKQGTSWDDLRIGMWNYYHNSRSVQRIEQFAKIYAEMGTLDLDKHVFPLPVNSNHAYRSTWGAGRNWGGYRIHEGTDIFAGYGVPVRSTSYGVVEIKGWNRYGGWRIGIRDIHNVYHYYAHLSGYSKNIHAGYVVKPGDVVGWVGSSGYGKPGTQGKFPPHLHYGLYRDSGWSEWPFDPYPYLVKWEREERMNKRKK
ncbi:M23 family metallopeptidase [Ferviditalea candida]|uniref:M23 family metallopeptidase n=1 Tax=Ferviditalea candida TaxID=3108399 RepID=A0ABU5ZEM4_9BACL|nr:M23 family metallopeptidase [Paenibacillaceae bacterium T2]